MIGSGPRSACVVHFGLTFTLESNLTSKEENTGLN